MASCLRCGCAIGFLGGLAGESTCSSCIHAREQALATWTAHLDSYLADRVLTPGEEVSLRQLQFQLGLTDQDVQPHRPRLLRAKALAGLASGQLPVVFAQGVVLWPQEQCHFTYPAFLLEETTARVSARESAARTSPSSWKTRTRHSAGVSVGLQMSAMVPVGQGSLCITNQRLVFIGARPFEVLLSDLVGIEPFNDGLWLSYKGAEERASAARI